jgi:ABC-type methionine transport system permease subunit
MLLPNNMGAISLALGKIAAQLVGYSTIIGALGFGGLGELVVKQHLDQRNLGLVLACILVIIAFNKVIDYTFSSFTRIVHKV